MAFSWRFIGLFIFVFLLLVSSIAHSAPTNAHSSCSNEINMMLVKLWVNGAEEDSIVGLSAAFGSVLPTDIKHASRLPAVYPQPLNGCSASSTKLSGSIALVRRGECEFIIKATVAQEGGAGGVVLINNEGGSLEIACPNNSTISTVTIPVVSISNDGADIIDKYITSGKKVELLLYSPDRPIVDYSVCLIWLMAVGTIICAALWKKFTQSKESDDYELSYEPPLSHKKEKRKAV
ncbi:Signal peptide peptidase-like 2A [Datura stramonium]|uniref:Signal peptide peptidase-like 2A n=1 Tax=Datura stramonium TaxID=4076 RepID=A0ABS8ST12_DATST|nr:Signal peptide peptidase-like 2A [Datura stramonium]